MKPKHPNIKVKLIGTDGKELAYRVVGKMKWDGSYRSFIEPE